MNEFESNLNILLVDVFNYILRVEEQSLKSFSGGTVTVTEAHILEAVGRQAENAAVSQIAMALGIAVPTATVALKKLEKKGYVSRSSSPNDARRSMIGLTEAGRRLDRAHSLFHRSMVSSISRELSEAEKDVLLVTIQKLRYFFSAKVEDK